MSIRLQIELSSLLSQGEPRDYSFVVINISMFRPYEDSNSEPKSLFDRSHTTLSDTVDEPPSCMYARLVEIWGRHPYIQFIAECRPTELNCVTMNRSWCSSFLNVEFNVLYKPQVFHGALHGDGYKQSNCYLRELKWDDEGEEQDGGGSATEPQLSSQGSSFVVCPTSTAQFLLILQIITMVAAEGISLEAHIFLEPPSLLKWS